MEPVETGTFDEVTQKAKIFRRFSCFDFMTLTHKHGRLVWLDTKEQATLRKKEYKKMDWMGCDGVWQRVVRFVEVKILRRKR